MLVILSHSALYIVLRDWRGPAAAVGKVGLVWSSVHSFVRCSTRRLVRECSLHVARRGRRHILDRVIVVWFRTHIFHVAVDLWRCSA